jgi:uncharacterized protein (DUF1501 family)
MLKLSSPSRRRFLIRSLAYGCTAAASPFVTPVTFAAAPGDNRLVVIILRGAMDGLDVVRPLGDPHYALLRPTLAGSGPAARSRDLDGFFALHERLARLMPLWKAGELGFVHAVSTPYRDKRSHFDGQDILEAGIAGSTTDGISDGWLNRLLQHLPGATAQTAYAVGRDDLLILRGEARVSRWTPEQRLDLTPQSRLLLETVYHDDPLFQQASDEAIALAEVLEIDTADEDAEAMAKGPAMMKAASGGGGERTARLAAFAAERLNDTARIAAFSINGWDTHYRQEAGLDRALGELQAAILALREGLGTNWGKTAVLAMTEFGRTARENGSGGTDHGTGGLMLLAGGAVRGGKVYGRWPGLGEGDLYQGRDLMPTGDVRAYAAWAMAGQFGLPASAIEGTVFPDLDMGADPHIIA